MQGSGMLTKKKDGMKLYQNNPPSYKEKLCLLAGSVARRNGALQDKSFCWAPDTHT